MKRAVFALWLTTLALTAAAQDLPVPAQMPPPMRVPMPSLATESVSATAPITLTTSAPVTTPMPSSVSTSPSPAPGDIDPESRVLPAPPPPGLPVVVMTQAVPCNVDMAYRKKNVDCALSVLKGVLTIIDLGSVPEVSLEEAALRAGPTGGGKIFSERGPGSNRRRDPDAVGELERSAQQAVGGLPGNSALVVRSANTGKTRFGPCWSSLRRRRI